MKITLPPNNIQYLQDLHFRRAIPAGIEFEVVPVGKRGVKLYAPGYGTLPAGDGAIYVSSTDWIAAGYALPEETEMATVVTVTITAAVSRASLRDYALPVSLRMSLNAALHQALSFLELPRPTISMPRKCAVVDDVTSVEVSID